MTIFPLFRHRHFQIARFGFMNNYPEKKQNWWLTFLLGLKDKHLRELATNGPITFGSKRFYCFTAIICITRQFFNSQFIRGFYYYILQYRYFICQPKYKILSCSHAKTFNKYTLACMQLHFLGQARIFFKHMKRKLNQNAWFFVFLVTLFFSYVDSGLIDIGSFC